MLAESWGLKMGESGGTETEIWCQGWDLSEAGNGKEMKLGEGEEMGFSHA